VKAYPKYKDSGIEWLGEVPMNWGRYKLKYVLSNRITDGPHETPEFIDSGIPFFSADSIQNGELVTDQCRFISFEDHERFQKKSKISKDDILLCKAASTGKIARVKVDFEFSVWSPLAIIKLNKELANTSFIEYMLKSPALQSQIDILCTNNTQQNISMDDIPLLELSLPSIFEQQAIASFLDRETSRIDALIQKKERMIELLKEKRIALITQAVTKGLDPNVPMKDSGIEWLGEVPEHWEVIKMKYLGQALIGLTYSPDDVVFDNGTLVLRSSNIQNSSLSIGRDDDVFVDAHIPGKLMVIENDILICSRNGSRALIGKSAIIKKNLYATFGAFMTVYRSKFNTYIRWVLQSSMFSSLCSGYVTSTINQLTQDSLNNISIPLPPESEITRISNCLESEIQRFKTLMDKTRTSISLLREYRASLIHHAVTGKIDLRGYDAPTQ